MSVPRIYLFIILYPNQHAAFPVDWLVNAGVNGAGLIKDAITSSEVEYRQSSISS